MKNINKTFVGTTTGSAISLATLSSLGTVGLSATGITSGLTVAGGLVGGGMLAGASVLALPVMVFGFAGYQWNKHNEYALKEKKLNQLERQKIKQDIEQLKRMLNEDLI